MSTLTDAEMYAAYRSRVIHVDRLRAVADAALAPIAALVAESWPAGAGMSYEDAAVEAFKDEIRAALFSIDSKESSNV